MLVPFIIFDKLAACRYDVDGRTRSRKLPACGLPDDEEPTSWQLVATPLESAMPSSREAFLERVRQAVQVGNRPGSAAAVEPRGGIGYQGAGPDPLARFREELNAAGGQAHIVSDRAAAGAKILELVQSKSARRILIGSGQLLDSLDLVEPLRSLGVELISVHTLDRANSWEVFFSADLGITAADYLVAETGSIALLSRPEEPRSLSLLPPVHIAVAEARQLLPDLFDLFDAFSSDQALPSCLSLITGPSKTGDIELRLVTGVHGPGEIHCIVITG